MTMTWKKNGSADLRIDDAVDVPLPPKLAELMRILSMKTDVAEDGFPSFVGYPTLGRLLGGPTRRAAREPGSTSPNHAVAQLVHRLRVAFEKKGLNPFIIDTDRKRGVRLLLRNRLAGPVLTVCARAPLTAPARPARG